MHADGFELGAGRQAEMKPLARLGKIALACPQGFHQPWARTVRHHLDPGPDPVPIHGSPRKPQGQERPATTEVVSQELKGGCGAIGEPDVLVAILVPIRQGQAT